LEGTFTGHLVKPPCSEQGHLQLYQLVYLATNNALNAREGKEGQNRKR